MVVLNMQPRISNGTRTLGLADSSLDHRIIHEQTSVLPLCDLIAIICGERIYKKKAASSRPTLN